MHIYTIIGNQYTLLFAPEYKQTILYDQVSHSSVRLHSVPITTLDHYISNRYITEDRKKIVKLEDSQLLEVFRTSGEIIGTTASSVDTKVATLHSDVIEYTSIDDPNSKYELPIPEESKFKLIPHKLSYSQPNVDYLTFVPINDDGRLSFMVLDLQTPSSYRVHEIFETDITPAPDWQISYVSSEMVLHSMFYDKSNKIAHLIRFASYPNGKKNYDIESINIDLQDAIENNGVFFMLDKQGQVYAAMIKDLPPVHYTGIGATRWKKLSHDNKIIKGPIQLKFKGNPKIKSMHPININAPGNFPSKSGVFFITEDNRLFGIGHRDLFSPSLEYHPGSPREMHVDTDIGELKEVFMEPTTQQVVITGTEGFHIPSISKPAVRMIASIMTVDSSRIHNYVHKVLTSLCTPTR